MKLFIYYLTVQKNFTFCGDFYPALLKMELINLKSLNLTMGESRDTINFIALKIGISIKIFLSTIKPNLKRKNKKILTTKTLNHLNYKNVKILKI